MANMANMTKEKNIIIKIFKKYKKNNSKFRSPRKLI